MATHANPHKVHKPMPVHRKEDAVHAPEGELPPGDEAVHAPSLTFKEQVLLNLKESGNVEFVALGARMPSLGSDADVYWRKLEQYCKWRGHAAGDFEEIIKGIKAIFPL